MRAVVQRVTASECRVEGARIGAIDRGLLVFVGVGKEDDEEDVRKLSDQLVGLRVFDNEEGKLDRDVRDVGGGLLLVPQFTLYGDTDRGRRPSFHRAADPDRARDLYERLVGSLRAVHQPVESGRFGAHMRIEADHDGPVTLWLDTASKRDRASSGAG